MSLLKRAIDARASGERPEEPRTVEHTLGAYKTNFIARLSADGILSVVATGDDRDDRDRIRFVERVFNEWETLPDAGEWIRATEYMKSYEASRLAANARGEFKTKKKKEVHGLEGVREGYI